MQELLPWFCMTIIFKEICTYKERSYHRKQLHSQLLDFLGATFRIQKNIRTSLYQYLNWHKRSVLMDNGIPSFATLYENILGIIVIYDI